MKRIERVLAGSAVFAALLWLAGCCGGVERRLNKCNKNLQKTMLELDNEQAAAARLEEVLKGTKQKLDEAKEENAMLTNRLEALGQDVAAMKLKGEMTEEERAELAERLAEAKIKMAELQRRQQEAEARMKQFRNMLLQFQDMIKSGEVKVAVRDGRLVVELAEDVLFDSGQARLKKAGQKALSAVTQILKQVPDRKFQVAGHTDNIAIRTRRFASNWELSTARAVNVVKFMQEQGMEPDRLSAAGYGEFSPVASNDTPEGRAENRRIEIVLQPNLSELPSLEGVIDEE